MNLRLQIWVTGTDLDVSGALAPLKTDESGCSAQVIPFFFFLFQWPNLVFVLKIVALKKFDENMS
jgi:hypothetical protein